MVTFIFKLARDSSPQEIERIQDELSDRFPQHRFVGNGEGLDDVDRTRQYQGAIEAFEAEYKGVRRWLY